MDPVVRWYLFDLICFCELLVVVPHDSSRQSSESQIPMLGHALFVL